MDMEILLSVLLFALVSTITPGPNNIMVMTSGMNFGVCCVFQTKVATDSRRSLPPIPRESCH